MFARFWCNRPSSWQTHLSRMRNFFRGQTKDCLRVSIQLRLICVPYSDIAELAVWAFTTEHDGYSRTTKALLSSGMRSWVRSLSIVTRNISILGSYYYITGTQIYYFRTGTCVRVPSPRKLITFASKIYKWRYCPSQPSMVASALIFLPRRLYQATSARASLLGQKQLLPATHTVKNPNFISHKRGYISFFRLQVSLVQGTGAANSQVGQIIVAR